MDQFFERVGKALGSAHALKSFKIDATFPEGTVTVSYTRPDDTVLIRPGDLEHLLRRRSELVVAVDDAVPTEVPIVVPEGVYSENAITRGHAYIDPYAPDRYNDDDDTIHVDIRPVELQKKFSQLKRLMNRGAAELHWSLKDGQFVVRDVDRFERTTLPRVFGVNRMSTLRRILFDNGFIEPHQGVFSNPEFIHSVPEIEDIPWSPPKTTARQLGRVRAHEMLDEHGAVVSAQPHRAYTHRKLDRLPMPVYAALQQWVVTNAPLATEQEIEEVAKTHDVPSQRLYKYLQFKGPHRAEYARRFRGATADAHADDGEAPKEDEAEPSSSQESSPQEPSLLQRIRAAIDAGTAGATRPDATSFLLPNENAFAEAVLQPTRSGPDAGGTLLALLFGIGCTIVHGNVGVLVSHSESLFTDSMVPQLSPGVSPVAFSETLALPFRLFLAASDPAFTGVQWNSQGDGIYTNEEAYKQTAQNYQVPTNSQELVEVLLAEYGFTLTESGELRHSSFNRDNWLGLERVVGIRKRRREEESDEQARPSKRPRIMQVEAPVSDAPVREDTPPLPAPPPSEAEAAPQPMEAERTAEPTLISPPTRSLSRRRSATLTAGNSENETPVRPMETEPTPTSVLPPHESTPAAAPGPAPASLRSSARRKSQVTLPEPLASADAVEPMETEPTPAAAPSPPSTPRVTRLSARATTSPVVAPVVAAAEPIMSPPPARTSRLRAPPAAVPVTPLRATPPAAVATPPASSTNNKIKTEEPRMLRPRRGSNASDHMSLI